LDPKKLQLEEAEKKKKEEEENGKTCAWRPGMKGACLTCES
jgi:hypothetical protein